MSSSLTELQDEFFDLLHHMRRMQPNGKQLPEGLTANELHVLIGINKVVKHCGCARAGAVASHGNYTKSAFSQVLKSLEEKGCVVRQKSATDSRGVELVVTELGSQKIDEAEKLRKSFLNEVAEYVGEDDLRHAVGVLRKVLDYQSANGFSEASCKGGAPCN